MVKAEAVEAARYLNKHIGAWQRVLWTPSQALQVEFHKASKKGEISHLDIKRLVAGIREIKRIAPNHPIRSKLVTAEKLLEQYGAKFVLNKLLGRIHSDSWRVAGMKVEQFGATHVGLKRTNNEDRFHIDSGKNLFVVADGMGGHKQGEVAAENAVEAVKRHFYSSDPSTLHDAVLEAHGAVRRLNETHTTNMGSTLTAMHLTNDGRVYVAHVGDSTLYRLRRGKLKQMTHNDTVAQGFLDNGVKDFEPRFHNVLTQCIGIRTVDPQVFNDRVEHNDVYLLASDGLDKHVSDLGIKTILKRFADGKVTAERTANHLITLANAKGGSDNTTTIVLKVKKGKESTRE